MIPHSTVPFIGPILMIAGYDLDLGADFDASYEGLFYARHQLDIKGGPTLNGQVIALNEADTDYETKNPVTKVSGVMVIAGNPTINYSGNGLNSVRALTWRECRGNWAGTTFAGGVMTSPGNSVRRALNRTAGLRNQDSGMDSGGRARPVACLLTPVSAQCVAVFGAGADA